MPLDIGALAAYGFAWGSFPFRDTRFLIVVALMIIPIQTSFVPLLKFFRDNGHLNNGYWASGSLTRRSGYRSQSFCCETSSSPCRRDLIEAARMDGASEFSIFRRVVVPLSVPALASFGIFQFLWVWNDLLMALIFVPSCKATDDRAGRRTCSPHTVTSTGCLRRRLFS